MPALPGSLRLGRVGLWVAGSVGVMLLAVGRWLAELPVLMRVAALVLVGAALVTSEFVQRLGCRDLERRPVGRTCG